MISLFTIYFFLLGLIVGSFLNVVLLRFNTGRGLQGRSGCMTCKRTLSWLELVPVLSWLVQKGRCKGCRTKISAQYPIVELLTGLLFAGNFFYVYSSVSSVLELIVFTSITTLMWVFFILIFAYDLKHKIIPDFFSFSLFGVSVLLIIAKEALLSWIPAYAGMTTIGSNMATITSILAGVFFYFCIWLLWKISKGTWIGLGDAKLLLSVGTILGFVYGLSAIFIAFWIGTIYALYMLTISRLSKTHKHITIRSEIPLGPFLIIGFLIVYFTHIDVTNVGLLLEHYAY